MNPSLRMMLLAGGLLAAMGLVALMYQNSRQVSQAASEQNREIRVEQAMDQAEKTWIQVLDHFEKGQPFQAWEGMQQVVLPTAEAVQRIRPDFVTRDGVTTGEWLTRRKSLYREASAKAYETMLDQLMQGDINPVRVQAWQEDHAYPEIIATGALREAALLATRTRAATNWFRVFLEEEHPFSGLRPIVERAFSEAWAADEQDLHLVFGPALSADEQTATLKTVAVRTTLGSASFKMTQPSALAEAPDWTPPDIPIMISLSNRVVAGTSPASSWDQAGPFHAYLNPPKAITRNTSDKLINRYRELLLKDIDSALQSLPDFQRMEPSL